MSKKKNKKLKKMQICNRNPYECSKCALQDTSYCPLEDDDINKVCAKVVLGGVIIAICLILIKCFS